MRTHRVLIRTVPFFFTGMRFVRTLRQINRTTQWSSRRSFVCYCYFFYRADCDVRLGTELTFCENVTRCVMLKILSSLLIFAPETKPTCRHLVIFFFFLKSCDTAFEYFRIKKKNCRQERWKRSEFRCAQMRSGKQNRSNSA